jgi:hypothetical protein
MSMTIDTIEIGDIVSIERVVSDTNLDRMSSAPGEQGDDKQETVIVLATIRDVNTTTETVSLRRADTGEVLTDVAVAALQPAAAATDEEHTPAEWTDDESED